MMKEKKREEAQKGAGEAEKRPGPPWGGSNVRYMGGGGLVARKKKNKSVHTQNLKKKTRASAKKGRIEKTAKTPRQGRRKGGCPERNKAVELKKKKKSQGLTEKGGRGTPQRRGGGGSATTKKKEATKKKAVYPVKKEIGSPYDKKKGKKRAPFCGGWSQPLRKGKEKDGRDPILKKIVGNRGEGWRSARGNKGRLK